MKKLGLVLLCLSAMSLAESLGIGTSVSHQYQARSLFSNPAALAYQSELNGSQFLSSLSWGWRPQSEDDFALAMAMGSFGIGYERFGGPASDFGRVSLGLGSALSPTVYLGGRFSFSHSETPALSGVHRADLALQYRPLPVLGFGFVADSLNQPTVNYRAGVALRPIPDLTLWADVVTRSDSFGENLAYQGEAEWRAMPGLALNAGYRNEGLFHFGFQFGWGFSSVESRLQPTTDQTVLVSHLDFSTIENESPLPATTAVQLKIDSSLSEEGNNGTFFTEGNPSLWELVSEIERAKKHAHIRQILIHLDSFPLGWASAQELFEALSEARRAGKSVTVHLGNADLKEYLIASAANEIVIDPSGSLRFLGPKSERYYFKGTLDKIGIEPQILAHGEYKSAPESFTRKGPSEKSRENTLENLKGVEQEFLRLTQIWGRIPSSRWKELQRLGILSSGEALTQKLVDKVESFPDTKATVKNQSLTGSARVAKRDLSLPSRIAIVHATGDILNEKVRLLSLTGGSQVTPSKLEKLLDAATSDPLTRAIVLRVSSGGGDVLASQEMAALVKKAGDRKPIYVSMGDAAASGGYFISAPAHKIFANSLTYTGSIGVFTGKASLAELYKKIDLHKELISFAPFAGLLSEARPWTTEETAVMQRQLNHYYAGFTEFVAKNRKLEVTAVDKVARGRVWLGKAAQEIKLVDETGSLAVTIAQAAKSVGLSDFQTWEVRQARGLFEFSALDSLASATETPWAYLPAAQDLSRYLVMSQEPFRYWWAAQPAD